jgi:diguanylate cyclase (GGDEF)-like protein
VTAVRHAREAIGQRLRNTGDLVARYGGEDFAVLLPDTEASKAAFIAEDLRAAVEKLAMPHPFSPHRILTASFGFATTHPDLHHSAKELLAEADQALYRAKQAGRNRTASLLENGIASNAS